MPWPDCASPPWVCVPSLDSVTTPQAWNPSSACPHFGLRAPYPALQPRPGPSTTELSRTTQPWIPSQLSNQSGCHILLCSGPPWEEGRGAGITLRRAAKVFSGDPRFVLIRHDKTQRHGNGCQEGRVYIDTSLETGSTHAWPRGGAQGPVRRFTLGKCCQESLLWFPQCRHWGLNN